MKTTSLLVIFWGIYIASAFSQQDYLKMDIKDSVLECGNRDSVKTIRLIGQLKSVNPATIDSNRQIFYNDLGMCYYNIFILKQDTSYLRLAIKQYELAIKQDSVFDQPYWNAAMSYFFLNDCSKSRIYLDQYLVLANKKTKKQLRPSIKGMRNKCRN